MYSIPYLYKYIACDKVIDILMLLVFFEFVIFKCYRKRKLIFIITHNNFNEYGHYTFMRR